MTDWIDDDGGLDFDEFQEDTAWASDMIGMQQRRQQLNELQEVKSLLKQQQKENERIKSLPKCPSCLSAVEKGAKKCPSCRDQLVWVKMGGEQVDILQPFELNSFPQTLNTIAEKQAENYKLVLSQYCQVVRDTLPRFAKNLSLYHEKMVDIHGSLANAKSAYIEAEDKYNSKIQLHHSLSNSDDVGIGCVCLIYLMIVLFPIGMIKSNPSFENGIFDPVLIQNMSSRGYIDIVIYLLIVIGFPCFLVFSIGKQNAKQNAKVEKVKSNIEDIENSLTFKAPSLLENQYTRISFVHQEVISQETVINRIRKLADTHNVSIAKNKCYSNDWNSLIPRNIDIDYFDPISIKKLAQIADSAGIELSPQTTKNLKQKNKTKKLSTQTTKEVIQIQKDADKYWIKRGVSTSGPLSLEKMQELIKSKKAKPTDEVAVAEDGPWKPLKNVYKSIMNK
jgi:hypothetical protein